MIIQSKGKIISYFKFSEYWRKTERKTLGWSPQRQVLLGQALECKGFILESLPWESVRMGESHWGVLLDKAPQNTALACRCKDTECPSHLKALQRSWALHTALCQSLVHRVPKEGNGTWDSNCSFAKCIPKAPTISATVCYFYNKMLSHIQ